MLAIWCAATRAVEDMYCFLCLWSALSRSVGLSLLHVLRGYIYPPLTNTMYIDFVCECVFCCFYFLHFEIQQIWRYTYNFFCSLLFSFSYFFFFRSCFCSVFSLVSLAVAVDVVVEFFCCCRLFLSYILFSWQFVFRFILAFSVALLFYVCAFCCCCFFSLNDY